MKLAVEQPDGTTRIHPVKWEFDLPLRETMHSSDHAGQFARVVVDLKERVLSQLIPPGCNAEKYLAEHDVKLVSTLSEANVERLYFDNSCVGIFKLRFEGHVMIYEFIQNTEQKH